MTPRLASLNICTQIALIILVDLITKLGNLVVRFANNLQQDQGVSIRKAVEKVASIRLRRVLTATLAMMLGDSAEYRNRFRRTTCTQLGIVMQQD